VPDIASKHTMIGVPANDDDLEDDIDWDGLDAAVQVC
jgi:hypothetical protein